MRLRKSCYGIPQATANWHDTFDDLVTAIGFTPLKSDPWIYIYTHMNGIHNPVTKKLPPRTSMSMIVCWWGRPRCCSCNWRRS